LQNILALCNLFDDVSFSFVKREGNSSAHLLALWVAFCNNSGLVSISISDPSLLVAQALERDGQRPMSSLLYPSWLPFVKQRCLFSKKKKKGEAISTLLLLSTNSRKV